MSERRERRQTAIGLVGALVAGLCCVTPVLVVLFGALGLSAALGWIDYVLIPALAFFIALTVRATRARHRRLNTQRKG